MKVILHGQLREQFGASFEIQARCAADAIEGLSRQLPDWPRDLVIDALDFDTHEKLQATTQVDELHLVPTMFGGGGKFFNIIIGVALIALVIFAPAIGLALSATMATALLSAGIAMTLGGVMSLFMKAPSVSKSEDPPASKYFGINDNTVDSSTPITLAYGRINLFGHWLSLQSDADNLVVGTFPGTPT